LAFIQEFIRVAGMTHRIAILTEIIAPYRIPVFNALAKHEAIDLNVIFFRKRTYFKAVARVQGRNLFFLRILSSGGFALAVRTFCECRTFGVFKEVFPRRSFAVDTTTLPHGKR